jgi:DnaJ-class molecular chaperone
MSDTDWTPTDCPQCGASARYYPECFQGCTDGSFTAYKRDPLSGEWTPYQQPCETCQGQGRFVYCPTCRSYLSSEEQS